MFFGFDLKKIFIFPIKDEESRKHFLIGCVVSLLAFIVPILPYLVLFGYAVIIAKQVLNSESPKMVSWDTWSEMLKDGAKLFGIRMIFSLPIILLALPIFFTSIIAPIFLANSNGSETEAFFLVFTAIILGTMCLIIPLSIPLAFIIPVAEMYMIEKNDFAAAFRFREWFPILRANLSGFIAAFGIYYITTIALTFVIQIIGATLILACLLPFLMPTMIMYSILIMYATIAQAYKDGKNKLAEKESAPQPA